MLRSARTAFRAHRLIHSTATARARGLAAAAALERTRRARFGRALTTTPWFRRAGEGSVVARFGRSVDKAVNARVLDALAALDASDAPPGVTDLVPAYASLAVHFDPSLGDADVIEAWVRSAAARKAAGGDEGRLVEIPTVYDGPDLDAAAETAGFSSPEAAAAAHAAGDYRVYFLGFTAGFPYLGGLDAALATVPRLDTPRQVVPRGAVGVAAGQTGVYTRDTPGGWHLLGRTAAPLFDAARDPPALLRPGDRVRFVAVEEAAAPPDPPAPPGPPAGRASVLEVVAPGVQTSVQDLGRRGHARHGVSRAGAADEMGLRTANALVGNAAGAPALEVAAGGFRATCVGACAVGLAGADCGATVVKADGASRPAAAASTVFLRPGDELRLGAARDGARAYVAVAGGVASHEALGSASSDLRAGLGGRALAAGDVLGTSSDVPPPPSVKAVRDAHPRAPGPTTWRLRLLPGPGDPASDDGSDEAVEAAEAALARLVAAGPLTVTPRADRMAVVATSSVDLEGGQQLSEACPSGTVQLPPDGNPVVLLAEHQTTGGYFVPAVVARCDLWKVGQARPGDSLELEATTPAAAAAAFRDLVAAAAAVEAVVGGADVDVAALARGPNQLGDWPKEEL